MKTAEVRCFAALVILLPCVAPWSRCGSIDHDVDAISQSRAGPDAIDCGFADGNAFDRLVQPPEVRGCIATALANGDAFYGSASPASADGGTTTAYTYDGQMIRRVRHDYSVPVGLFGCYREDLDEEECGALVDKGDDCGSDYEDLCFTCSPVP